MSLRARLEQYCFVVGFTRAYTFGTWGSHALKQQPHRFTCAFKECCFIRAELEEMGHTAKCWGSGATTATTATMTITTTHDCHRNHNHKHNRDHDRNHNPKP